MDTVEKHSAEQLVRDSKWWLMVQSGSIRELPIAWLSAYSIGTAQETAPTNQKAPATG